MSTKFEIVHDANLEKLADRIAKYKPSRQAIQDHYKRQTLVRLAKFLFLNHLVETELELAKLIHDKLVVDNSSDPLIINGESAKTKKKKTKKSA